jgi:hypothetical protein
VLCGCVSPLNFGAPRKGRRGSSLCSAPWLLDFGWKAEERGAGAALLSVGKAEGEGSWAAAGMDREEEEGGGADCWRGRRWRRHGRRGEEPRWR